MESLTIILSIVTVHLLAVISPGPDFIMAVKNSMNHGRTSGVYTSLGFALGILVHLTYCYFGIALLISQSPVLFSIIKILGALYLLHIAIQIFIHRKDIVNISSPEKKEIHFTKYEAIMSGFWTNVLNPKATLFFLGLFSTFIPADIDKTVLLMTCVIIFINQVAWFSLVAVIFTQNKSVAVFNKYSVYINTALSMLLIILSGKILVSK